MYLKKIEILGFKSFAKKTTLEFDRGIISVVGPNGSGKSNFADAIRWVLGEQSMKAIRSKKSEDVIFAGSDRKSRLGMAEVAITFDNEDRRLPVDFSEVVISRRLYRDGESEYLLNKHQVRLMDIVELLAKSGYGNNSYHVISQGSIDQMIIAGPAAIKNLIEEASGVKPYYNKRERTLRKLARTEQNLARVADLISEIEPRLRSLRRQAKKFEQREEIQNELSNLLVKFFTSQYQKIHRQIIDFERQTAARDQDITAMISEIGEREKRVKELEQQTQKHSQDYLTIQEDLRRTEKKKNQVQEELATIRGQLKVKISASQPDHHVLQLRQMELQNRLSELKSRLSDLGDQGFLEEKNLSDHKKIFKRLSAEIEKLRKSLEFGRSPIDLNTLKADMEKVYSRYQSLLYGIKNLQSEADFNQLQEDALNLELILVKLKNRVAQISDTQLDQAEVLRLNEQMQKTFSQKEQLQEELVQIQTKLGSIRSQQKFYSEQITEVKEELAKVEQELKTKGVKFSADEKMAELSRQEARFNEDLQRYFSSIRKLEADLSSYLAQEAANKKILFKLERELRSKQDELSKIKDRKGLVLIEKARSDTHLESLYAQIRNSLGHDYIEKVKSATSEDLPPGTESRIQKLKSQLDSIGGVDDLTLQEYRETESRYTYLTTQSKDLQTAVKDLRQVIGELDAIIKRQFQNGFDRINDQFLEYFRVLFAGGKARMSLIKEQLKSEKELEESDLENGESEKIEEGTGTVGAVASGPAEVVGVDIKATPPGKKLATLSALSGGERTLTSIALLMSILTAFPSPFVVLDEVDAALDEANSIRFGKILAKLAHQIQFITITHNRETMRQSSALYGITMGDDGISRVLSIKLDKAVEIAQ